MEKYKKIFKINEAVNGNPVNSSKVIKAINDLFKSSKSNIYIDKNNSVINEGEDISLCFGIKDPFVNVLDETSILINDKGFSKIEKLCKSLGWDVSEGEEESVGLYLSTNSEDEEDE